jgi:hypothetical protein
MKGSVFPGDTMSFAGEVHATEQDDSGCAFATVDVTLSVEGDVKTTCTARIAVPRTADDNPWARRGADWRPSPATPSTHPAR